MEFKVAPAFGKAGMQRFKRMTLELFLPLDHAVW